MRHWIFISSTKRFRMHDWLSCNEYVEYIQRNKVEVNDIVCGSSVCLQLS